jgi:peptide-methionine (R)-S-oxide reductase
MTKRGFLRSAAAALGLTAFGGHVFAAPDRAKRFELMLTDAQWKKRLTADQYAVLREHDTERAGSSPLNDEKRRGSYHCAGCDLPVYPSTTKFDSGTGWPSFWQEIKGNIGTSVDRTLLFITRTEVHCRRCGGHFGHVFDDGPKPTGLRHCINGVALTFKPARA